MTEWHRAFADRFSAFASDGTRNGAKSIRSAERAVDGVTKE
ncbi:MAG: hypothetical protein QOC80_681 [Frankiaceae bacterium]|nr:hypothetical protein [Frankiaceae bacterium]